MYPDSNEGLNREDSKAIYFFTPSFHPFDNFSAHAINIWGKSFPTAEHAYQWKKFASEGQHDIANQILSATSPHMVKTISDRHKPEASWHKGKVVVMEQILKVKADQHEDVRDALKRSGAREIIENSPVDTFWGIGPKNNGENMMGKIWMKIRKEYRF